MSLPPILKVDDYSTLMLDTPEALKKAIVAFSTLTINKPTELIGSSSISSGSTALIQNARYGYTVQTVVEQLFDDIKNLSPENGLKFEWDEEAPGIFNSCAIGIKQRPDGKIIFWSHHPYILRASEIELAKKINAPLGYEGCRIKRNPYRIKSTRFAFPLKYVGAVYSVFRKPFDPEAFVAALLTPKEEHYSESCWVHERTSEVVIKKCDSFTVTAGLLDVYEQNGSRNYKWPERNYKYEVVDERLIGPAILNRFDDNIAPGLEFRIIPTERPTFDMGLEKQIKSLGKEVQTAWEKFSPPENQLDETRLRLLSKIQAKKSQIRPSDP